MDAAGGSGELPTQELLARHRAGDRAALEALFARYAERVRRMARVRTGAFLLTRMELDDVVSEALLEALQSIERYEPREDARFVDWLSRVVAHKIRNLAAFHRAEKRDAGREVPLDRGDKGGQGPDPSSVAWELAASTTDAADKVSRQELIELVDRCLQELSETHSEVILLREYAGGEWAWVAEQLGSPSAHAAEQLFQRARAELRERVSRRLSVPPDRP